MLSDFLGDSIMQNTDDQSWARKENIVVYNPAKGIEHTRSIMALLPSVPFVPLSGLSPVEAGKLLGRAKCYIDFGGHPGKDRIPREAAINGCCIIVGKCGSACFFDDVPIPDRYKVNMPFRPPVVANIIEHIFDNYFDLCTDFKLYRTVIRGQERVFQEELLNLVATIQSTPAAIHLPSAFHAPD